MAALGLSHPPRSRHGSFESLGRSLREDLSKGRPDTPVVDVEGRYSLPTTRLDQAAAWIKRETNEPRGSRCYPWGSARPRA